MAAPLCAAPKCPGALPVETAPRGMAPRSSYVSSGCPRLCAPLRSHALLHHPEVSGSRNRLRCPLPGLPFSSHFQQLHLSTASLCSSRTRKPSGSAPRCSASRHVHRTLAPARALSTRTPASRAALRRLTHTRRVRKSAPEEHSSSRLASPATDLCCLDQTALACQGRSPGRTGWAGSEVGRLKAWQGCRWPEAPREHLG